MLGGVVAALQAFSAPGEAILVHSPTYTGFTSVLNNNGRRAVHTELKRDAEGIWRMDYEDMDKKIKENHIHLAIFCSPHNPSGRVWEREEIEAAMEVYRKNDCIVISDEIWSDLTLGNRQHIPTQTVSEDAKKQNDCNVCADQDVQSCRTDRFLSYCIQPVSSRSDGQADIAVSL